MIVPQNRLLVWVGLIVLPFAALGAVVSSAAIVSVALIAALGVVVLSDAILGYSQLEGLGAEGVASGRIVRLGWAQEPRYFRSPSGVLPRDAGLRTTRVRLHSRRVVPIGGR